MYGSRGEKVCFIMGDTERKQERNKNSQEEKKTPKPLAMLRKGTKNSTLFPFVLFHPSY